jgi:hypothetical protein
MLKIGNANADYEFLGNQLKKIPNNLIRMPTFGVWHNEKPLFKKCVL